jgi:hypothetical protein
MLILVLVSVSLSAEIRYQFDRESSQLQADMRNEFSRISFLHNGDQLQVRNIALHLPGYLSFGALRKRGIPARLNSRYHPADHNIDDLDSLLPGRPGLAVAPVSGLDRAALLLNIPHLGLAGYVESGELGLLFDPEGNDFSAYADGDWNTGEASTGGWVCSSGFGGFISGAETLLHLSRFEPPSWYLRRVLIFQRDPIRIGAVNSGAQGVLSRNMRFSSERVIFAQIDPTQQLSFRLARSYLVTRGLDMLDPDTQESTISMRAKINVEHLSLELFRSTLMCSTASVLHEPLNIFDVSIRYVGDLGKLAYDIRRQREQGAFVHERELSVTLEGDHLSATIRLERDSKPTAADLTGSLVWHISDQLTLELESGSSREVTLIYKSSKNRAVSK